MSAALNSARRSQELARVADGEPIDVLVIGGGITGAGIALDAATRGLRTVLVERHDLAWGTSRWSSKLVHGGLRYLATGDVGVAYESAVERRILMTRTAPHLVRPLPQLVPRTSALGGSRLALVRAGLLAGDALRWGSGSSAHLLPRSRRVGRSEALRFAPTLRTGDLQGGMLGWDGQLIDDARLVVAVARTAASFGAKILTRVSASDVTDTTATLHDELTREQLVVRVGAVVNATGVWAGEVDPSVRLRPSRGTHLVFSAETFGGLNAALMVPVAGEPNRFALAVPAQHGRVYVGLTDEPAPGPVPDVPVPSDGEIDLLLETIGAALREPLSRTDLLGAFAGLRPLLDAPGSRTADLSRRHAVRATDGGPVTVVGGKLTTYRRMAQDAVDTVAGRLTTPVGPCRTASLPLVGASRGRRRPAPASLVARYGSEAADLIGAAGSGDLEPIADGVDVCAAELAYGVSHEGALDADDLLDRRTRIGLVAADRERALPAAQAAVLRTTVAG